MFSVGLWGRGWDMTVLNLDIGADSSDDLPVCIGAFVSAASDIDDVRSYVERTGDIDDYSFVPWVDEGTPRLWVIRNRPCPTA
jgi:hypothetical protein